ncbi:YraN family protein [Rathayibacter soli]|uniref:YraN family protein n=1 Tax=Rathayibacter soli TaxID=3144168 RepID=UPI0027E46DC7|nr:YraN family protein [Glaciibacter superstes]
MAAKDTLGRRGEELAAEYLQAHGYRLIDRNWRCNQGELDLIVERDGETVFVEVKTRSSLAYGHPFEAITAVKVARLRRLAAAWCAESEQFVGRARVDAVAVIASGDDVTIEHLEGVG